MGFVEFVEFIELVGCHCEEASSRNEKKATWQSQNFYSN